MRVALVCRGGPSQPNIGLAYVHSALRRSGIDCSLLDLTFAARPQQQLAALLRRQAPEIVGLSSTTVGHSENIALARLVKELLPRALVVVGGVHPTLLPRETISEPAVDAICLGEGELALAELARQFEQQQAQAPPPGIWLKRAGRVIAGPARPTIDDLDCLAFPDWSAWELEPYRRNFLMPDVLWVLSSRGCVYRCDFCSNRALLEALPGRHYRERSADNVVDEILHQRQRLRLRSVFFESENLNVHRGGFFARLAARWREERLERSLIWGCKLRADLVTADWVKLARELGCVFVSLGLESGSEQIRRGYGKQISDEAFRRACALLERHGILFNLNVMFGTPFETPADLHRTVRFTAELRPTSVCYNRYIPLPRTALGEIARTHPCRISGPAIELHVWYGRLRDNLRLLGRGLRELGLSFVAEVAKTACLGLHRTVSRDVPDPASPVKAAWYRLAFSRAGGGCGAAAGVSSGSPAGQNEAALEHSEPPAR